MAPNPFTNQLSALEQIDFDLIALLQAVIANQQAAAALSTTGVQRTLVDFIDVTLSSTIRSPLPVLVNSQPAVAAASAVLVAANTARRYLKIKNSTAVVCFLHFGAAAALVTNYPLAQGETWETISPTVYTGEIRAITGGGATTLNVIEG